MILYTEHSRAELLNRVWVWLECSHLFLYMVISGVCVRVCVCVHLYACVYACMCVHTHVFQFSRLVLYTVIQCLVHAWMGVFMFQHSPKSRPSAPPSQNVVANSSQPLPGKKPGENPRQTYQTEKPLTEQDTTKAPSKLREMHDIA